MPEPRRPVPRPVSKPVAMVARNKEAELTQLERRYRSTFKKISENDECTIVRLAFPPSDPDFPFELDMLQLQLRIPTRYPKESCTIIVMNANIPKGFAFNLEKGFENYTKQSSATLVRQMNWLDKNIETLLQQEPATTMRFVSTTPKPLPKPEEKVESLIAPALPEDFIAAATTKAANMVASSPSSSAVASSSSSSSSKPSMDTPKQQQSNKKSRSTLSLSNQHDHHRRLDAGAVPFFASSQLSEAAKKREKELKQLEARFRASHKVLRNNHAETVVQLVLNLEDPEFSYKDTFNKELKIKYHIPIQYPLLPCTIEVENKALGFDEARDISYVFAEHVEKSKRTLFQNLNWLNRNLETILQYPPERPWEIKDSDEETSSSSSEGEGIETYKEDVNAMKQQQSLEKGKSSSKKNNKGPGKGSIFDEDRARVVVVDDPRFLRPAYLDPPSSSNRMTNEGDSIDVDPSSDPDNHTHADQTTGNKVVSSSESSSQPIPRNGTAIYIYNYQLENITLFRCIQLNMVVKCSKCKTMADMEDIVPKDPFNFYLHSTKENSQVWKSCTKCGNLMGVKFFSDLMHQSSNKLGLLQVNGCLPFDILPSKYIGACVQCMDDDSAWTLTPHDHPKQSRCFSCHTPYVIALGDVRFIRTGVDDGNQFEADQSKISKAMLKRKQKKEVQLTVGEPLPDKGTCDHYRKSKRWFRFPCCSRLYPCDVCHDKQEEHIYELARRHVCGQCSREQAITPQCICGHVFERSHSRFWEGGEGTRSKILMSRKDPHKYKGLGKTTSKKQERVGTAGKSKRKNE